MKETLYIRISGQEHDPIQWLITHADQVDEIASGTLSGRNELSQLSDKATGRKVVVMVNSANIRLKSLKIPGKNERAIRSAAPYMIEDDLAQDVEKLYFAFSPKPTDYTGNDNCFFVVVEHRLIQTWLTWFSEANIVVKVMIPDVLALPYSNNDDWDLVSIDDDLLIRISAWEGYVVDKSLAPIMIENNLDADSQITINSFSSLSLESEKITIEQQPEELPLLLLAKGTGKQPFNLLQDEYQIKEVNSPLLRNWLWVAGIAFFALCLNLTGKAVELVQLNNQYDQINEDIRKDYLKVFPNTKTVRLNTIKKQLSRKIIELGGSSSDSGLLALMEQLTPSFQSVPSLKPESLRYDAKRNELRINVTAKDYQSFEKFKASIEASQLVVESGAQNNQGDQVVGSFNIRSK